MFGNIDAGRGQTPDSRFPASFPPDLGVRPHLLLPSYEGILVGMGLLLKYRNGDANVRSVWLCSRNDAIGNLAVIVAATGVWATATAWPDLIVAGVMASLFLWSSAQIVRQAQHELACNVARDKGQGRDSVLK